MTQNITIRLQNCLNAPVKNTQKQNSYEKEMSKVFWKDSHIAKHGNTTTFLTTESPPDGAYVTNSWWKKQTMAPWQWKRPSTWKQKKWEEEKSEKNRPH